MPTPMKLLFELLPVPLFLGALRFAESQREWATELLTRQLGWAVGPAQAPLLLASAVAIAAAAAQLAWLMARRRQAGAPLWASLALVALLGGTGLWMHDEPFAKWEPSVLYWALGLALWLGSLLSGRNLLRLLVGEQLPLPDRVWHRLKFAWVAFFGFMGLANLWVAYGFSTEAWVDFKVYGSLGLTALFMLAQAVWLSRHLKQAPVRAP